MAKLDAPSEIVGKSRKMTEDSTLRIIPRGTQVTAITPPLEVRFKFYFIFDEFQQIDAAVCGVISGAKLFAYVQQKVLS